MSFIKKKKSSHYVVDQIESVIRGIPVRFNPEKKKKKHLQLLGVEQ